MNSLLTTTLLLLAASTDNTVSAFAPSPKSLSTLSRQQQTSKLAIAPLSVSDLSFLISDAADAVADAASTAVDAVTSADTTSAVQESSSSFSPTYSKASYYTTLALYVASFPGLWSQIKRSTKAKVKRKTYVR